jgi:hypothetical protein
MPGHGAVHDLGHDVDAAASRLATRVSRRASRAGAHTVERDRPGVIYQATVLGALEEVPLSRRRRLCVPGGAAVVEQTVRSANTSLDLAGNTVVHARLLLEIVPGAAGCSVQVYLNSPASGRRGTRRRSRWPHDPGAQVAPR